METQRDRRNVVLRSCLEVLALLLVIAFLFSRCVEGADRGIGHYGYCSRSLGVSCRNANITVQNDATKVEWRTVSSGTGGYIVRGLPPGTYNVTVQSPGFQKSVVTNVVTEVEKVSTVDASLKVGAETQEITVNATGATLLNTESGTVGTLITPREITTLPLNGRSWISLNFLTPGAVNFHGTTANESVVASVTPPNVVLNGLRGGNNAYYIDGSSLQVRETQVVLAIPPLDALNEFRVQTSNVGAEYTTGVRA